jgi:hypothetical protein
MNCAQAFLLETSPLHETQIQNRGLGDPVAFLESLRTTTIVR